MGMNKIAAKTALLAIFLAAAFPASPQDSAAEDSDSTAQDFTVEDSTVQGSTIQVNEEAYYILRTGDGEQKIIQRLSWPDDENAYRYEVIIERQEDQKSGEFAELHREFTQKSLMEVSLGPGNYRYRVRIYNLFDQPEYTTNWGFFTIIAALQPVLQSFSPEKLFFDDIAAWELDLDGEDFMEGISVYLEPLDGSLEPIPAIQCSPRRFGRGIRAVFNRESIPRGSYRVIVKNPGGLEDSREPLKIRLSKPQLSLSVAYSPLMFLHGYMLDLFDKPSFVGATLRAELEFFKKPWGILGVEESLSWNYFVTQKNNMDISAHIGSLETSLFFRKRWSSIALTVYAGTGLGSIFLLEFDYDVVKSEAYTNLAPLLDLGLACQWYVTRRLYADLGIKYIWLITRESPQPGYIRPSLGAGWRF
jgi:hypothetical protein